MAPAAIFGGGMGIFGYMTDLNVEIAADAVAVATNTGIAFPGRILLLTSVVLLAFTSIGTCAVCIPNILQLHRRSRFLIFLIAGSSALVISIILLAYLPDNRPYVRLSGSLFPNTLGKIPFNGSEGSLLARFDPWLDAMNILVLITALAVISGTVTCLAKIDGQVDDKIAHLRQRMQWLRVYVGMGAVVLVLGMLSMVAWMYWPMPFVNSTDKELYREIVFTNTLYQGMMYMCVLASIYIIPAAVLRSRALKLAHDHEPEKPPSELRQWRLEHGLTLRLSEQISNAAVVLAPLIFGPAMTVLFGS